MTNPQNILNTLDDAEKRIQKAKADMADAANSLATATIDLAAVRSVFETHAVDIQQGDLMLDAMTYAVSQSSDPAWQADVRALISKLTGMDSYQVSDLCDEAGR